jgi:prepilin-type N-terminal cleavage/methylation domain-containing protein
MDSRRTEGQALRWVSRQRTGFTLVELLTVVAIITLLIGILVPTLSRARQQAKATATRAILKAVGEGLDLFKNENPEDCRGGEGYPSSAMRDDPTEPDEQMIFGAQWLVRDLMGKTLDGYIPRRNVPRDVLALGQDNFEQAYWYDLDQTNNPHAPLERVGPYLLQDRVTLALPKDLDGADGDHGQPVDEVTMEQPVILDSFGYPVLYYAANTRLYKKMKAAAPVAGYSDAAQDPAHSGIYAFTDNGLFTGSHTESGGGPQEVPYEPWDFAGIGETGFHKLANFGAWTDGLPTEPADFEDPANTYTFPNYILNKAVYESTKDVNNTTTSLVPYHPDSFLLITPGPDGIYGTEDDVTNF